MQVRITSKYPQVDQKSGAACNFTFCWLPVLPTPLSATGRLVCVLRCVDFREVATEK